MHDDSNKNSAETLEYLQKQSRHQFKSENQYEFELHSWLNTQSSSRLTKNHFICAHNIPALVLGQGKSKRMEQPNCGVPSKQLQLAVQTITNTFKYLDKTGESPITHRSAHSITSTTTTLNLPEYWITEQMKLLSNSHTERIILGIFDSAGNLSEVGHQQQTPPQTIEELRKKYKHHISFRETPPYCWNFQRYSWWVPSQEAPDAIPLGSADIQVSVVTYLEYNQIFKIPQPPPSKDDNVDQETMQLMMKRFLNFNGNIPMKVTLSLSMNGTHVTWDKNCIEERRILSGEKESSIIMDGVTEICFTLRTGQADTFHMLYWQLMNALEDFQILSKNENTAHWCLMED
jgi:hypothetical protein